MKQVVQAHQTPGKVNSMIAIPLTVYSETFIMMDVIIFSTAHEQLKNKCVSKTQTRHTGVHSLGGGYRSVTYISKTPHQADSKI